MSVVVICDDCGEIMRSIDRMADAGPPPHRCEACHEALDWETDEH